MSKEVDILYNKNNATMNQAQDALDSLDSIFTRLQTGGSDPDNRDAMISILLTIHSSWKRRYPQKDDT